MDIPIHKSSFASTRPVQIATNRRKKFLRDHSFASTRPVQIATDLTNEEKQDAVDLCLHTPRADCNSISAAVISVHG